MNTLVNSVTVVAEEDNPLLSLSPGLMIWTMIMFLITLFILKKYVFGPSAR